MMPAQQILALIAIPSTLILIVQTVMVLFGFAEGGDGGDVDAGYLAEVYLFHHLGILYET